MEKHLPASVAWQVWLMMLLKQIVSAPAVQMALCIRTATPGCPRAREDNAEHVVVSYTDCLTLDAAPDGLSVSPATMIVTVEPTLPGEGENIFVMSGHITEVLQVCQKGTCL